MIIYAKSHVGYSHLRVGGGCQDHSSAYQDEQRAIVSVADGHGGKVYIRSDRGSKFACEAVMSVFKALDPEAETIYPQKLKLQILCAWNALVEADYGHNPFTEEELASLDEDERDALDGRPEKAYGTTLLGVVKLKKQFVIVHLGDGESLVYKAGQVSPCFDEEDDEPVANVTYSMCGEDVLKHMKLTSFPLEYADFVLLCSDGAANPYRSYDNLVSSFVKPVLRELSREGGEEKVDRFVESLAEKNGIGDDVSIGVIGLDPIPEPVAEPEAKTSEVLRLAFRLRFH